MFSEITMVILSSKKRFQMLVLKLSDKQILILKYFLLSILGSVWKKLRLSPRLE